MQDTYMVVRQSQLKEHSSEECAGIEAMRLAYKLDSNMYVVKVIAIAHCAPLLPENHGKPWTRAHDTTLLIKYMSGKSTPRELAPQYKRTVWAIQCRLHDLGLGKVHKDSNYRGW